MNATDTTTSLVICVVEIVCFGFIFVAISTLLYFLTKSAKIDFEFEIGDKEKHKVKFYSETMFGQIKIFVDGVVKYQTLKLLNGDATYNLIVGNEEKHNLTFQLKMPLLFGAYRERVCEVYEGEKLLVTGTSAIK